MKKLTILFTLIFISVPVAFAQKTETGKTKDSAGKEKLPAAKKLFENYVKASGGEKAIKKIKSRSTTGTVELPAMGLKGNFEILTESPDKTIATINLNGLGEIIEAFDGSEAWAKNPLQGLRVKSGAELEEVKKSADIGYDFNLARIYPKAIVSGLETRNGAEVYVVKGDEDTTFYFDKKTNLLMQIDRTITSPQGKLNSVTKFEDYRDVDGVKQPYKFTQSAVGADFVFTVSEIKQNIKIDGEKFSRPK